MSVVGEERCARDCENARDKLKLLALPRFLVSVVAIRLWVLTSRFWVVGIVVEMLVIMR